jgi:alpha-L-glutamate ligase-like protein
MIGWVRKLHRLGEEYVGINRRNLELVDPLNPRRARPLVDDKLLCKDRLESGGVRVPRTVTVVEGFGELGRLGPALEGWGGGFVIKPARSSGGKGILVVRRGADGVWRAPGRGGPRAVSIEDVREHVAQILCGMYTTGKSWDRAFAEELVEPAVELAELGTGGLPDVRVIMHREQPVLAMLRVATERSGGRANLHQGAIGLGVDLETGLTHRAICRGREIGVHPDTRHPLLGVAIPRWLEVLEVATRSARAFELGFLGVDVVIDARRGPLVLEVNARPGLAIQLANGQGLRAALARAEAGR